MSPAGRNNRTAADRAACGSRFDGGFTLIEVLISLVILSTGIVLILQAFQTALTALGESRDAMQACMIIREKVSEAQLQALKAKGGDMTSVGGAFDSGAGMSGTVGVKTGVASSPDGSNVLNQVSIKVGREKGTVYYASTYVISHSK